MSSHINREINKAIIELERVLQEGNTSLDFTALRALSHFCESLLKESDDQEDRVIPYILSCFINNLIINFGGDTIYDTNLLSSKRIIYENIMESLKQLLSSIERQDTKTTFNALNMMIKVYYEQLNKLNDSFKKS